MTNNDALKALKVNFKNLKKLTLINQCYQMRMRLVYKKIVTKPTFIYSHH